MKQTLDWRQMIFNVLKISWGLLVHPYQSMQSLVKSKKYVWLLLLPTLFLFVLKIVWVLCLTPIIQHFYTCGVNYFFGCQVVNIVANWLTFFCMYWQIVLIYLALRFGRLINT